jgi:hypothetical protein
MWILDPIHLSTNSVEGKKIILSIQLFQQIFECPLALIIYIWPKINLRKHSFNNFRPFCTNLLNDYLNRNIFLDIQLPLVCSNLYDCSFALMLDYLINIRTHTLYHRLTLQEVTGHDCFFSTLLTQWTVPSIYWAFLGPAEWRKWKLESQLHPLTQSLFTATKH